jgi:hypothetical protein
MLDEAEAIIVLDRPEYLRHVVSKGRASPSSGRGLAATHES